MIYNFSDLRISSEYPPMPMYADPTSYLEEYFFNYVNKNINILEGKPQYLPIYWTPIYVQNAPIRVQSYLNVLDRTKEYFTIVQYDEGILNTLPFKTKVFAAASDRGNGTEKIPIPLITTPIPTEFINKYYSDCGTKYLCSFVGRDTHIMRKKVYEVLKHQDNVYFPKMENWEQTLPKEKLEEFIRVTKQSTFGLAIRGNAPASFRLYEIMQLGSIPVYVSDIHWLPFQDEINWKDFCVIVKPEEIKDLKYILEEYNISDICKMKEKGTEIYKNYFTLEKVCDNILKRV